jgi:Ni,Fe-hydrogenase III large subunit
MTTSIPAYCIAAREIPYLDARDWRAELLAGLRAGLRLVTMYGRRERDDVTITTAALTPDRAFKVSRTVVRAADGYHELTSEAPALHCFERELHEQTRVHIAGHGWLKPVRYEGQDQAAMNGYPFHVVEGKEVHEVAVGPIHAGVIEPGSFRFSCLGEQVHHLEIQLGYQHRGVERRLLELEPHRLAPLVETIAGDTSIGHAWAYCAALESLMGQELDLSVDFGRALLLELERVAMHLAALAGLAADIGFLQGATSYGRLRTTAINTSMKLCGSRFGRGGLRPGGVRMRLDAELLRAARASVELLRDDVELVNDLFETARTVQHRLRGVGTVSAATAQELGLVGLAARASGLWIDARHRVSDGAYRLLPIRPVVHADGDCWSRAVVRIEEVDVSLRFIATVLAHYADFQQPLRAPQALAPNHLAISLVEGFRGEIVHCLETGDEGRLLHYKVQDPSFRNWMGLPLALRGNEISDFPICNKSFDLSYCGNDL